MPGSRHRTRTLVTTFYTYPEPRPRGRAARSCGAISARRALSLPRSRPASSTGVRRSRSKCRCDAGRREGPLAGQQRRGAPPAAISDWRYLAVSLLTMPRNSRCFKRHRLARLHIPVWRRLWRRSPIRASGSMVFEPGLPRSARRPHIQLEPCETHTSHCPFVQKGMILAVPTAPSLAQRTCGARHAASKTLRFRA